MAKRIRRVRLNGTTKLVTRQWMIDFILNKERAAVVEFVGRALVGLLNRQTDAEQQTNETREDNGIGFTGADAYSGSITAKYYIKNKTLARWMVKKWIKPNKNGVPRIAKYHYQLNEIAVAKKRRSI